MTRQPQRNSGDGPSRQPLGDIETADLSDESSLSPEAGIENPEANDFERSQEDMPIDDPGDAQRSSKSEPDGDGEEEER